jgi:hypothetical protein
MKDKSQYFAQYSFWRKIMTKHEMIEIISESSRLSAFDENQIKRVSENIKSMNQELFDEWFSMQPGDKFWGKTGNSWGHSKEHAELVFIKHGGWFSSNPSDCYQALVKCEYMLTTFLSQFGGLVSKGAARSILAGE